MRARWERQKGSMDNLHSGHESGYGRLLQIDKYLCAKIARWARPLVFSLQWPRYIQIYLIPEQPLEFLLTQTKITNIYKCIDLEEKATFLHFLKNPSILFPYFLLQQSFLPCTEEYQTPWTCALISSSGGSSTSTTPTQTQVPPRVAKEVWKVGLGGRVSGWRVMFLHEMLEYIYIFTYCIYSYICI